MGSSVARILPLVALCLGVGLFAQAPERRAEARMPPALLAATPRAARGPGASAVHVRYDDIVERAGREHGISARLIHAIIAVESAYRADGSRIGVPSG